MTIQVAPHESCVACLRGDVSTGLASRGVAEWHVALLIVLGLPQDEATNTIYVAAEQHGCDFGQVPSGSFEVAFRVCEDCANGAGLKVAPLAGPVPAYEDGEGS
jgi:hypothetical protein